MSNYGKAGAGLLVLLTAVGTYFLGKINGKVEGFAEGRRVAKAEHAEQIKKLKATLANMVSDIGKRDDFILAAYALGVCCLNANGQQTAENTKILDDLVAGLGSRDKLPQIVQEQIAEMIGNPPNLPTVWALINERQLNDAKNLKIFGELVGVMTSLDELKTQSEMDFMASWNTLLAA
ncbi:hypothetical protein J8628_15045 [Serratia fonticola]|uniref:hypothetical protein n=1 Tax=Serratia fonticola TaxID=47917 RepID=UPI001AEA3755|nr:hypothetical protein [Serratia fonticola]MBP1018235.1 hypothetical protein [Serratia fonticola]